MSGRQLLKSSYVLSKSNALEQFPMLKADKLVGALVYYDGHTSAYDIIIIIITVTSAVEVMFPPLSVCLSS